MRILFVLLCCLVAATASGAEPVLVRAEQAFDALEFDTAEAGFREALRRPGTHEERVRAWRGLALASAFMGMEADARAAFEALLLVEPDAEVSRALGPKVRAPYEAAREALRGRQARLGLRRTGDGRVVASLEQPRPLAAEVVLYVRQPGDSGFVATRGRVAGVSVPASPVRTVEAYAVALDAAGGVLFEEGSARAPVRFEATEALLPTVHAPGDVEAEEGPVVEEGRGGRVWPWILGGVGVVAAGVVAGIVIAQPPPLNLPPADRTGRLP
ncbi:hypothetical protein P2318_00105 [Myxococcaceae bacterium GXIMD 01537]